MADENESNNGLSQLDANLVLRDVHLEQDHALQVLKLNSLVPRAFNKVDLEYVTSGYGVGEVGKVTYRSNGETNITRITMRGDYLGEPEISKFQFNGISAPSLSGKYFLINDAAGSVGVWFDVDNGSVAPITGALRNIEIDIASADSSSAVATKFKLTIDADAQFIALVSGTLVTVTSAQIGDKTNAVDVDTSIPIVIINGSPPNSLNNKYFLLFNANDAEDYYVWYDVDNTGVDPAVAGKVGIEVNISAGDSANVVAIATKAAINVLDEDFLCEVENQYLSISNRKKGSTTATSDFNTGHLLFQTTTLGQDKYIVAIIELLYNANGELSSAERLEA